MSGKYWNFFDARFKERLARAHEAYSERQYDAAIRVLNELDRNFPNRREILDLRRACLQKKGIETFSQDAEETVSASEFHGDWAPDEIARKTAARTIDGKAPADPGYAWTPGQAANPIPENPVFEYAPEQSDLVYRVIVCAILVAVAVSAGIVFGPPKAGATRTFYGMKFVWVPLPESDGKESDGGRGIWLGKYEVSRSEWAAIMDEDAANLPRNEEDLPVSNITRQTCLEFVDRLDRKGEGHFRIPTSSEWLRACRATTSTSYSFGDDKAQLDLYSWYAGNSDSKVHVRGKKRPNPWGFYDMHGNVAEWCVDRPESDTDEDSLETSVADDEKAIWLWRGGSANLSAELCSSTSTEYPEGDTRNRFTGLRLLRDPGPSTKEELRPLDFPENLSLGTVHISKYEKRPAMGKIWVLARDWVRLVVDKDGVDNLPALTTLEADSIQEVDVSKLQLENEDLEGVASLEGLQILDLSKNRITDEGLALIENSTALRVLNLSDTLITGDGLDHLSSMTMLQVLNLSGLAGIDDQHLIILAKLPNLESLDLRETSVTTESLTELQIWLPQCKILPSPDAPSPEQRLSWAKVGKKYSMLLEQFRDESASRQYGIFKDFGYSDRAEWGGEKGLPAGYWVFVQPFWYIWQDNNSVRQTKNRPWAPENLVGRPEQNPEDRSLAAWAPSFANHGEDWLMIEFETPMRPENLIVVGLGQEIKVSSVVFFDLDGREFPSLSTRLISNRLEDSWETQFRIRGEVVPRTNRVFLRFESSETEVSNRRVDETPIGAIGSIALRQGAVFQWTAAAASSSYFGDTDGETEMAEEDPEGPRERLDPSEIEFRGLPGLLRNLNELI